MLISANQPAAAEAGVDRDAVVVTGTGLVCALGLDRKSAWQKLCSGGRAFGPLTVLEQVPNPQRGGAQAAETPPDAADDEPREVAFLHRAVREALAAAGVDDTLPYPPERCGIVLGTTLHGMRAAGKYMREQNAGALRTFQAAAVVEQVAKGLPIEGAAMTTCAACSSGLSSIGLATTLLQSGELDFVIAGGYDTISEYAYGGFNALRLIASGNVRPFCRDREGMKLGEGYGILILERAGDAAGRGARTDWRVLGIGETADAHHLTQPHPEGEGAARAMRAALEMAHLTPGDIDLISAHGTGTPSNEKGESAALLRVFEDDLPSTPIVALKTHLGHTLGGAGAVELILALTALENGVAPPTANVRADEVEYPGLRFCDRPVEAELKRALSVSVGFGGANTCAVVGRPHVNGHAKSSAPRHQAREVVITGVGVVLPGAIGNEAFARLLLDGGRPMIEEAPPAVNVDDLAALLQAPRVRRMSDYVKLSLAATKLAITHAGLTAAELEHCAAMLGTAHGSAAYSADYYRQIVVEGVDQANAMLFAEGVPNAGAAHLSLMLGLKAACQTIIGSRTSSLDALRVAMLRIRGGRWDRAIVGAAEEATPVIEDAYRYAKLHTANGHGGGPMSPRNGFVLSQGAATLVLESREGAESRGAKVLGVIDDVTSALPPAGDGRAAAAMVARMLDRLGPMERVITSANSTWLGRVEMLGVALAARDRGARITASSLYGHMGETFSVMPLASIAAAVLTGRLPRLHGGLPRGLHRLGASDGGTAAGRVAVLASDPHGPLAAASVTVN